VLFEGSFKGGGGSPADTIAFTVQYCELVCCCHPCPATGEESAQSEDAPLIILRPAAICRCARPALAAAAPFGESDRASGKLAPVSDASALTSNRRAEASGKLDGTSDEHPWTTERLPESGCRAGLSGGRTALGTT